MKKIIFYDINAVNFINYTEDLLRLLSKRQFEIYLLYEEETDSKKAIQFNRMFRAQRIGAFSNVAKILGTIEPDVLVVNAQRIADTRLVLAAKDIGVKTVMIQHGMYNGFLKRESSMFMRKLGKTMKYLFYSFLIGARSGGLWPLRVPYGFVKVFIFGDSYKKHFNKLSNFYTDEVYVYGEGWIQYHLDHFGYSKDLTKFKVIGYTNLAKFHFKGKVDICYIAQSLVEDGRLSYEDFNNTLKFLQELNEKFKVVVKRHPRSDDKLYNEFNLQITDDIPDAILYIGHYSSLLAYVLHKKKKVALLPLEGHFIPDYFLNSAHNMNDLELDQLMKEELKREAQQRKKERVFN